MSIEHKEGRYFVGVWFCNLPKGLGDFMGALYRDGTSGPWTFRFRFAIDRPDGGSRTKYWAQTNQLDGADSPEHAAVTMGLCIERLMFKTFGSTLKPKFAPMYSDDAETCAKVLLAQSFAHPIATSPGGDA